MDECYLLRYHQFLNQTILFVIEIHKYRLERLNNYNLPILKNHIHRALFLIHLRLQLNCQNPGFVKWILNYFFVCYYDDQIGYRYFFEDAPLPIFLSWQRFDYRLLGVYFVALAPVFRYFEICFRSRFFQSQKHRCPCLDWHRLLCVFVLQQLDLVLVRVPHQKLAIHLVQILHFFFFSFFLQVPMLLHLLQFFCLGSIPIFDRLILVFLILRNLLWLNLLQFVLILKLIFRLTSYYRTCIEVKFFIGENL